jgi:hypothetical protein
MTLWCKLRLTVAILKLGTKDSLFSAIHPVI